MRIYELVEIGALLAFQAHHLLESAGGRLSDRGIQGYWSASRRRLDRWCLAMAGNPRADSLDEHDQDGWAATRPVLEEVFASDIVTRVWTGLAGELDRRHGRRYALPVVRSIFLGHCDARNRALNRMFHAQERHYDEVLEVNRFRRRSERWTDMLLAHLAAECETGDLAFERERVQQFAADLRSERQAGTDEQAWHLMKIALRAAFAPAAGETPHADLNKRIVSSVLSCFPPEVFDSTGLLSFLWMERLDYTAADLEAMIAELLEAERPTQLTSHRPC
jgi:hypothetical protein